MPPASKCPISCFNPRTRAGCDFELQLQQPPVEHVSIHAPARGATYTYALSGLANISFNPRTRAGCDDRALVISRAPPMFQSTHPRGVRPNNTVTISGGIRFQSTHPRGVRLLLSIPGCPRDDVSIHAPARGATISPSAPLKAKICFNPRTCAGCDSVTGCFRATIRLFQSTHPRGVRPTVPRTKFPITGFNPRTRAGCDQAERYDLSK